jgi:hypothetical protein
VDRWFGFLLGVLAVWRLTHLLHVEHGPLGMIQALRGLAARLGAGETFRCFYCLSLWCAAPAALLLAAPWTERVFTWLALSAGSILLEVRGVGPSVPLRDD